MSSVLFLVSRIVAILIVFLFSSRALENGYSFRELLVFISLIIFLIVSILYERKLKFFGISYAIYYFVIFFANNVFPYSYIHNKMMLDTIVRVPSARIPNDHYTLYFLIFLLISIIIFVYLVITKSNKTMIVNLDLKSNVYESIGVIIMIIYVLLPLQFIIGGVFKSILIVACTYFFVAFLSVKQTRNKGILIFGLTLSLIIVATQITWRFITIQYILPFVFACIYISTLKSNKKIKLTFKRVTSIGLVFIAVCLYGVISEMNKLDRLNSIHDIISVLSNTELLFMWLHRQTYRIFDIWTVLGGNIIDYTNNNGFFWGITYIKSLAPILGFDYVSLPKISADMISASYAQPGLVAEGYANFGVIGAVLNVLSVFFLAEYLQNRFIKKQNIFNLVLLCTPFSTVLLDGGTFNSAIFNIIFFTLTFGLAVLLKKRQHNSQLKINDICPKVQSRKSI